MLVKKKVHRSELCNLFVGAINHDVLWIELVINLTYMGMVKPRKLKMVLHQCNERNVNILLKEELIQKHSETKQWSPL